MSPNAHILPRVPPILASAADPTQLQRHLGHCAAARGKLHGLRGAAEAVDAFLSPRFVSTLAALAAAAAALSWIGA